MMKTKMLIDEGFLGKGISFRASYYHSSNLDPKKPMGWKQDKAMGGGGVLIEMACHALDLMYHFLGEYDTIEMKSIILYPERPREDGILAKVEAEDHALLSITMKNGMIGTIEVSKVVAGTNDDLNYEICGTAGAIKYEMMNPNVLLVYDIRENPNPLGGRRGFKALETINKYHDSVSNFPGPRFPIGWIRGHVASQYNFVRCSYEGRPASPSFKEGAYIQKLCNRIYEGKMRMDSIR
jgi:predicted dehydrogenase